MKHQSKQRERDKRCEENMAVLNKWKQTQPSVTFDWKSPIHLRITLNGQWTDFWPTTGSWYDPTRSAKGNNVETLINILNLKTNPKAPSRYCGQLVPKNNSPSILERLATIDYHINAIRTELRENEPKKATEPTQSDMLDVLDEKAYDDSWAKGDPFEKDELPPWNP